MFSFGFSFTIRNDKRDVQRTTTCERIGKDGKAKLSYRPCGDPPGRMKASVFKAYLS